MLDKTGPPADGWYAGKVRNPPPGPSCDGDADTAVGRLGSLASERELAVVGGGPGPGPASGLAEKLAMCDCGGFRDEDQEEAEPGPFDFSLGPVQPGRALGDIGVGYG